jgi:hypothetical protein
MPIEDLEAVFAQHFSDWDRANRMAKLNRRNDLRLPGPANAKYLHRIEISKFDEERGILRSYSLLLTSPLSGSRLYQVGYAVKAFRPTSDTLGSFKMVSADLFRMWGAHHDLLSTTQRPSLIFYFDRAGKVIDDGATRCRMSFFDQINLDLKSPAAVTNVLATLEGTGCVGSKTLNFRLAGDGNTIVESGFYNIDFEGNARDMLKRVGFGQP